MEHANASFFAEPRTWVGVAFILFFVIFGRKIWAALAGVLDQRTQQIRAELEGAAHLRQEAEIMLRNAQAARDMALAEAKTMLEQARAQATLLGDAARHEAEVAAARREQMAMDRIGAAEKAAVTEVRMAAAEVAAKATEQVIRTGFGAEADAHLVDRAILNLPSALAGRRAA